MRTLGIALTALLLATACSSAPPAPEGIQERKNRAADYLKFGQAAFQAAQYEQALSFYLIAVDLDTAVDHEAGMAASWNSVATAQAALGRNVEARAALSQAEALAAASGERTLVLQVAVNLVQADLAEGLFEQAQTRLAALLPFPATAEGAALEHAAGTLDKALEKSAEALAAFDRALALNTTLKLKQEMASNHFMKASVLSKLGRFDEAVSELKVALTLDKLMENTLGIGQDLKAMGAILGRQGRPEEGYEWYVRAYRLFRAAGLVDQQRKTLQALIVAAAGLQKADDEARYKAALELLPSLAQ